MTSCPVLTVKSIPSISSELSSPALRKALNLVHTSVSIWSFQISADLTDTAAAVAAAAAAAVAAIVATDTNRLRFAELGIDNIASAPPTRIASMPKKCLPTWKMYFTALLLSVSHHVDLSLSMPTLLAVGTYVPYHMQRQRVLKKLSSRTNHDQIRSNTWLICGARSYSFTNYTIRDSRLERQDRCPFALVAL